MQKEDWKTLAISRNQFAPASPITAGTQSYPGFTRELLQVQWRPGDPIDVYIVRPEGAVNPPVVVFLYSWPDDTDRFKSDAWCRNVTRHGFAAVGFVSALTGQRYHDRGWKDTFVTELPEAVGKSVHDVQLLLDYLGTRKDLDVSRAGIFGQGSGGTIALLAGTVEPRLKAIDALDPWGDWQDWFRSSPMVEPDQRSRVTNPVFLESTAPFDPIAVLPKLNGRFVRLEQSALNPSSSEAVRDRIHQALPSGAAYIMYSNEAEYRSRAMKDSRILDWLQDRLDVGPVSSGKPADKGPR